MHAAETELQPTTLADGHLNIDKNQMAVRAACSSIAGSALEWLDFAAYGAIAATVLPELFFPASDPNTSTLAAFASFTVGFIARPLGGFAFGLLGDRIGRRTTLIITFMMMGLASFAIGALPTYATMGIMAPVLLVVMRFAQGFALGGEVTGSQLLTMEHAPVNRRGFYSSFIAMGSPMAQMLANAILFVLSATLTGDQFKVYGWRIPFLISFVLVAIGLYVRYRVTESPSFIAAQAAKASKPKAEKPKAELRRHLLTMVRLFFVWAGLSVAYFVAAVYSLSYITTKLGIPTYQAFACLMIGHFVSMLAMALGGILCDRIGRRRTMLFGTMTLAVATVCFFPLLNTGNIVVIAIAIAVQLGLMQFHAGVQPAYFAEMFPPRARYAGSAISYNCANLVGSTAPLVSSLLLSWANGSSWIIAAAGVAMAVLSCLAVALGPETLNTSEAL
jgi:MFS family permease